MKKKNGQKRTIHLPASETGTLCGKPIATSILWAKKTSPTEAHVEWIGNKRLCRKCYALFAKVDEIAPEKEEKKSTRTPGLAAIQNCPAELVVTYKDVTHKATVNPDGTITVNCKTFKSPSRAGKEITGREVDGWTFWSYEAPGEGLKKLNKLRKPAEHA